MLYNAAVSLLSDVAGHCMPARLKKYLDPKAHVDFALDQVQRAAEAAGLDEPDEDLPDAWKFYVKELAPTVVIGASVSIFFAAWIFTMLETKARGANEDLSYWHAVWHCYITSTTVGYGDVSLTTDESRFFASVQILVAVSWLASTVDKVSATMETRANDVKRDRFRKQQLDATIISALNRAVPEPSRGQVRLMSPAGREPTLFLVRSDCRDFSCDRSTS